MVDSTSESDMHRQSCTYPSSKTFHKAEIWEVVKDRLVRAVDILTSVFFSSQFINNTSGVFVGMCGN